MVPETRKRGPSIEEFAEGLAAHQQKRFTSGTFSWEEVWKGALWFISDEGQYMREAGLCSILIYQKYVEFAVAHLSKRPDRNRAVALMEQLVRDLDRCNFHITRMGVNAFTIDEMDLITASAKKLTEMFQKLKKDNIPGPR